MHTYRRPYDDTYPVEPTDQDAMVLARALTHYVAAYLPGEADRTAESIVLDIIEANAASDPAMSRDEVERIAAVFGLEV